MSFFFSSSVCLKFHADLLLPVEQKKKRQRCSELRKRKIKSGIVPCMRKIRLKDYSGDLHLDVRRRCCTASLPGFEQSSSLLKVQSPTHTSPYEQDPSHTPACWGQTMRIHSLLGMAGICPSQTCQGHRCPIRRAGTSSLIPSFTFPGEISHFTTCCPCCSWSEGASMNTQYRCINYNYLLHCVFANALPQHRGLSHPFASWNDAVSLHPSIRIPREGDIRHSDGYQDGGTAAPPTSVTGIWLKWAKPQWEAALPWCELCPWHVFPLETSTGALK